MLWTAFLLGFLGSFHCLGMCGPIAMAVSSKDNSKYLANKMLYNFGRAMTYTVLGGMVGLLGFTLALAGIQQWLSIGMGVLILIMAFFYKSSEKLITKSGLFGLVYRLKSSLGYFLKKGGSKAFFASGVLNGLLPCGMVYIALIASLALQDPLQGAIYMFFFGIGTIPMLLAVMLSGKMLSINLRVKINKMLPYFAMFIGILFIVRGLGLGIHYVSPKLQVFDYGAESIEMTMCQ
ncbi:putative membrane copper tolerance protein [Indibacter alkaliphilus LW1]|jgi:sulfite exporter TauE/SafE|uniref:Membrane copper tolerance protein n=1 Tax=Indibacter alkaliphilus (strain CCUG 57479 / KCTC 22604 / LW1) TaxID=1189612 RepID=S2D5N5_INDAL|nr:sulfite exporter TauE/SafE family protein [Indibacter alkaliphilus]EOZ92385.1 putative membrane copper tolerance protein [Indibacter alkaliphilus LW1]